MDFSKFLFRTVSGVAIIGVPFIVGLYSAHHKNALYDLVYGSYDESRLVWRELPDLLKQKPIHFLRKARYEGSGLTRNSFEENTDELMLLSGFFQDHNGVRLIERDGTVVNEWTVSIFDTLGDPAFCRNPPATEWNAIPHGTIIEPDGDIVLSFESCGMVKLDKCSKPIWAKTDIITHHSPNFTSTGNIVISGGELVTDADNDIQWPYDNDYWEDLIFIFDPDGNLLKSKRMTELFVENDFQSILTATGNFSTWINGEFHLNEIEELSPEMASAFPMFEAGDLLLSVRNRNLILVVSADLQTIKWHQVGPWIRQHDADFQPDGTITLFDNHTDETDDGRRAGGSRIYKVDPATHAATVLYGGTPEQHFYSRERSTHQMQPDGSILITEAQGGRTFEVDPNGNITWEWVNRYDDDHVTWMHDAEMISKDYFTVSDWSCE